MVLDGFRIVHCDAGQCSTDPDLNVATLCLSKRLGEKEKEKKKKIGRVSKIGAAGVRSRFGLSCLSLPMENSDHQQVVSESERD
jgi:hypothetical protein